MVFQGIYYIKFRYVYEKLKYHFSHELVIFYTLHFKFSWCFSKHPLFQKYLPEFVKRKIYHFQTMSIKKPKELEGLDLLIKIKLVPPICVNFEANSTDGPEPKENPHKIISSNL